MFMHLTPYKKTVVNLDDVVSSAACRPTAFPTTHHQVTSMPQNCRTSGRCLPGGWNRPSRRL